MVKKIFDLCMQGRGPSQIAAQLEGEQILKSTAYKQRERQNTPYAAPENECRWHESSVVAILERMESIGATVNFKTYSNSIWDKEHRPTPWRIRKFSMGHTLLSSPRRSMTSYSKTVRSGIAERQQARAVFSPAWHIVLIVGRSCTTLPPAALKSDRTSLSAPPTA